ncbi:GumC family protein [Microvirga terricola]|uniref:Lipopolysaccharide biosynthesis protein n=1 Tax=Microvirga terricola TaxID=2719797 RepID=A0ABX0V760_9HYPH|nr:Wzz/FepE/Etk N-terminal domain-containing protein [Microvirga terricola]NIX75677.1 lipopolysaccharide biosynthesis protein [Microvirga terricola]
MSNIDLRFYLSIFLRRFPYFIAIVILVSAAGLALAYVLPPVYRADARILVESPQISTDLVRSTVPAEIVKQLQVIELQMMTRENLLALADKLHLYSDRPNFSANDIVDDMRSRATIEPIRFDTPRGSDGATAFSVSFKAKNPIVSADVVNEFVKLILQRNVRFRTDQASDTLSFLQQETEKLSVKLNEIEAKILAFKNDNRDALPENLGFRRTQQINFQDRLLQLEREEASLREGRSRLVQIFASTGRISNASMSPAEQTLEQFRRILTEQRAVFSETSPSIVALQSQISALERQIQTEAASGTDSTGGRRRPLEMDMQLAEMDRRLTLIAQEKTALKQDLAELNQSISATPSNEMALNALERQRQTIQTQYNMANARLADASAGQQIELRSKGERLSVLELATPPQRAIGPNRLGIAFGGLVAGVALGLGFIVLLELLNKTIRRPIELVEMLEIQPLATIPYIRTRGEAHSRSLMLLPATLRRTLRI